MNACNVFFNVLPYFVIIVSYIQKMFMKSTPVVMFFKVGLFQESLSTILKKFLKLYYKNMNKKCRQIEHASLL
jgi:hypothetical protein